MGKPQAVGSTPPSPPQQWEVASPGDTIVTWGKDLSQKSMTIYRECPEYGSWVHDKKLKGWVNQTLRNEYLLYELEVKQGSISAKDRYVTFETVGIPKVEVTNPPLSASAAVKLHTKGFGGVQSCPLSSKPQTPETAEIVLGERRRTDGGIDQERFKGYRDSQETHAGLEARTKLSGNDPNYLMKLTVQGIRYYVDSKTYSAIVEFQAEHPKTAQ